MNTSPKFDVSDPGQPGSHSWVVVDDVLICLTRAGDVKDEVWNRFCAVVTDSKIRAVLGVSFESVSLTSTQRKAIASATTGKCLGAVLASTMTRGILTALSWLGLNVKAFAWKEIDKALTFVANDPADVPDLKNATIQLLEQAKAPSLESLSK